MINERYVEHAREWLKREGHFADVDEMLLFQLADAIDTYNQLQATLAKTGPVAQYSSGPGLHPAYKGMEATAKRIIMLSDKLGLSPRARKGIKIDSEPAEAEASELDEFID